jgi:hypothetical protein
MSRVRSITDFCGFRVSDSYVAPKCPLKCKRCQRFGHTQRNCGYAPRYRRVRGLPIIRGSSTPREQPQCCGFGGTHTANYRGCIKWKEARDVLEKQAPDRPGKSADTGHPADPKAQRAGPSVKQMDLNEGWNHVVRGDRVVKATTTPTPNPNRNPPPVKEAPKQPKVTATRNTAGPKKPEPKSTAAAKPAAGKSKKKAKPWLPKPIPPNWWTSPKVPPPRSRKSPISLITFPSKHVWS